MCECEWIITIRCFPHSTKNGHEVDQKTVGMPVQNYTVRADGIDDAMNLANAIDVGIHSNPMVWKTEIVGVVQKEYAVEATQ